MPKLVWFNGEVMPLETARVPAADHAHLYGDGLFEGIRIYGRKVFRFDDHLHRIYHGMSYLGFEETLPFEELKSTILDVCRQADISDGYIRLNITRGTGLGLDPKNIDRKPNVMILVSTLALYPPEAYATGLSVVTSSIRMRTPESLDPRLKVIGGYASNILAKLEANRAGAGEALLLNSAGQISECSGDNIFLIQDGVVRTPHPACGILKGITRDVALEISREMGLKTEETWLTPFDAYSADEAFLTGTAAEVIPMVSLDTKPLGSGNSVGKPGPLTTEIIRRFHVKTTDGTAF